jgi:hypothetical protein
MNFTAVVTFIPIARLLPSLSLAHQKSEWIFIFPLNNGEQNFCVMVTGLRNIQGGFHCKQGLMELLFL